jgi:hypothetical protein
LPRPSLSRGESGPTLVAPPEVTSAITGRLDTLNTNSPFARDRSNPPPGRSRRRLLIAVLGGMLALGVTAAFVTRTTPTPTVSTLARGPEFKLDVVRAISHSAKPAQPAVAVQHGEPGSEPVKPKPVRHGRPEREHKQPRKDPASSSLTGATQPGADPPRENPFDRRH